MDVAIDGARAIASTAGKPGHVSSPLCLFRFRSECRLATGGIRTLGHDGVQTATEMLVLLVVVVVVAGRIYVRLFRA